MIEVVLSGTESEPASLTQVPPHTSHQTSMWHHHGLQPTPPGGLGMATADISYNLSPLSQHSMSGRKLSSVALGALPSTRVEDLLSFVGMESAIPDPMATSSQVSMGEITPEHASNIIQVSHSPSQPTVSKTLDAASISPIPQFQAPPGPIQPACPMRCFHCKGRWMWPWTSCSPLRPPWTPTEESWYRMPKSPCAEMRPRLPRPSKRQNSNVQLWLGRQRPIMKLQSRKWKPTVPPKLTLWNNPMRKVCLSWSVKW